MARRGVTYRGGLKREIAAALRRDHIDNGLCQERSMSKGRDLMR
jgi:hypothetical protein